LSENISNKTIDMPNSRYTGMFSGSFIFLIFRENIGIFDTIKKANKIESPNKKTGSLNIFASERNISEYLTRGMEAKNSPEAGVGSPRNSETCLVSMLNIAKRNAEASTIMKGAESNTNWPGLK